ncbi:MAG: gliding motility-associated C-terminal domain-containing protein, partial [Chitinophagaceae bacterium]
DQGDGLTIDNAGNVIKAGRFSGTNVDFDPSAATANMSSAGGTDGFVAKYTSTGAYLFSFRIGGSNLDEINDVTVDLNNNIYVTGFFRGPNVDFDPGAGTTALSSNGDGGGDPGYGGDMFVAKYTPAGQLLWAINVGGVTLGDNGTIIKTDDQGNAYIGGYFQQTADFDPGPGTRILDGSDGTAFLAKYSTNGIYQWAFNFGNGNDNNSSFDLVLDGVGNFYATGYFKGTNIDFDPGPATAYLSSNGAYEVFVSKYTTNGDYVQAFSIGGGGLDVGRSIVLDAQKNIYVLGDFGSSNVDFDPGAGTALMSTQGQGDVFLAKYSSTGVYQWSLSFGGVSNDFGWKLVSDGLHLFITGGFNGVSDLNPLPAVTDNLTSNGGNDIFVGKYTFDGEYLCAFKVGGTQDDIGFSIRVAGVNTFYMTGGFQDSNVDFDPTTGIRNMTSAGADDIFLAKYFWPDEKRPAGTLTGTGACGDIPAQLTLTTTAGVGPFNIRISDGINDYDMAGIQSGVPFDIIPQPTVTTTYSFVFLGDAQRCSELTFPAGNNVLIPVDPGKVAASDDTTACFKASFQLHATGAASFIWSPATGLSDPTIADPLVIAQVSTRYFVTGTSPNGCKTRDSIDLIVHPELILNVTPDTILCQKSTLQLSVSNAEDYVWSADPGLNDPLSSSPVYTSGNSGVKLYVTGTDLNGCEATDSVSVGVFPVTATVASNDVQSCYRSMVQLNASGSATYSWSPATLLSSNSVASPVTYPEQDIRYIVTGTDVNGCVSKDSVDIDVFDIPAMSLTSDAEVCNDTPVQLEATGGLSYQWTPVATLSNPAISNPIANPTGDIKYFVLTTDQNNCRYLDSVSLDVRPAPQFKVTAPLPVCSGDSAQLLASGGDTYQWSPAGSLSGPNIAAPVAYPAVTTTYSVRASESFCNNDSTMSVTVTVVPLPIVTASKANDLDCSLGTSQLNASGAASYKWTPDSTLSNGSVRNPVASPSVTTQYIVTGTSVNGCHSSDTVVVEFTRSNFGGYLMPNAFTPNRDGINDCFGIGYWGLIRQIEFSIFNRWGERVFYSEKADACWDGTYKGIPQDPGVFVYMIKASTICEPTVFRKGTFVLIR